MEIVDIIIVLGGGISEKGLLPNWVLRRLDESISLFNNSISKKILVTGKGRDGYKITEASAMCNYLIQSGIPNQNILLEELSEDTLQNAYYSRANYIDPLGCKSAIVITSKFHMDRTKLIFDNIFKSDVVCKFVPVNNSGIDEKILNQRAVTEYEQSQYVRQLFNSIEPRNLGQIHEVLFNESNEHFKKYKELGRRLESGMVLY